MSDKRWPHIRVETIDQSKLPSADNLRIFWDGEDISSVTAGIKFTAMVNELSVVELHLYASVELDGLVLRKGDE
ncbi:MAG: hypothetical protein KDK05_21845 [Candidatus Competibacteraceae bacterium]|nr:hypothetical protein [Candidatus Competibacteraceae bacterium]